MIPPKSSFFDETKSFVNNHKLLCALMVIIYAVGNLMGRVVSWIGECFGTTKKTDIVGRETISSLSTPKENKTNNASTSICGGLSIVSHPKLEDFIDTLKEEKGVIVTGNKTDTWHEVVFDNKPYEKSQVKCPWKLHICPDSDTRAVLDAIKPVLIKNRPYCKIVQNQEKLTDLQHSLDVNGKYVYKGKCLTIYPKSEEEALSLAIELNNAIDQSNLVNSDKKQQPCTDRPLGLSGYLWSRNDLAGGPIDELSMQSSDHAHAMPGNYDTTVILPLEAYDFETDERGRQAYAKWYEREFPQFQRITHKDIFKDTFGSVHWVGHPQSDQGHFETV